MMSHIKYKVLELNIKYSRAVQTIGYIGTSISYFLNVNLKAHNNCMPTMNHNNRDKDTIKTDAGMPY